MARSTSASRWIDLSVIAPVLGFLILIPPVIGLFATEATIFGAPLILVYLFAVWLGLIAVAAVLAQKLGKAEPRDTP